MQQRDTSKKGLAAVEFGLMLPVMALLLMLVVEGASAMHTYSTLVEASREGARHVLMEGDAADVQALISALIADLDDDGVTANVLTDPVANTVTVEVTYAYQPFGNENAANMFGGDDSGFQFVAQTTMPLQ